jgi:hypothetical protein
MNQVYCLHIILRYSRALKHALATLSPPEVTTGFVFNAKNKCDGPKQE